LHQARRQTTRPGRKNGGPAFPAGSPGQHQQRSAARPNGQRPALKRVERRSPVRIGADRIVYWYKKGERHADITGSPQAQQELPEGRWRMAWSNHAKYDGEKETLTLISSPGLHDTRMKNSIGDDGTAAIYTFSTKDDDDYYEADDEQIGRASCR